MTMSGFDAAGVLPDKLWRAVTDIRISDPERVRRAARARKRRQELAPRGRLNLLAADHPARRVTASGGDGLAMADRRDYLARIVRVIESRLVDGVMATMDVIEDLILISELWKEKGGNPLIDGKLLIGSLNRGGLAGTVWEMDDPMTGVTPAACADFGLDGTKILLRICDGERDSLRTMEAAAKAVTEANALGMPTFLEPLPVARSNGRFVVVKEKAALAKIVGVASALGDSSRRMWLKLPYCEEFDVVARATTLPILLLGGESAGGIEPFLREVTAGLAAGANVRGALVGRNVLYPGAADPFWAAEQVGAAIHGGMKEEA
jgi:hypothetical protein